MGAVVAAGTPVTFEAAGGVGEKSEGVDVTTAGVAGADESGACPLAGICNFCPGCRLRAVASVRLLALIKSFTLTPVLAAIFDRVSPAATVYSPDEVSTVAGAGDALDAAGAVGVPLAAGKLNFWPTRTVFEVNLFRLLSAAIVVPFFCAILERLSPDCTV